MAGDIPKGNYTLELGSSFAESDDREKKKDDKRRLAPKKDTTKFHTLRYDFKPKSASNNPDTFVGFGATGEVHVAAPTDGNSMTVYKGYQKESKNNEALLFFNKETGVMRLEKISSNINVKQTRDVDKSTEAAFRVEMARLKKVQQESQPSSSKNPPVDEVDDESSSSSDSSSSSSSPSTDDEPSNGPVIQKSSSNSSIDEMASQLLATVNAPPTASSFGMDDMPVLESLPSARSQHRRPATTVNNSNHFSLGLNLSESSEDESN